MLLSPIRDERSNIISLQCDQCTSNEAPDCSIVWPTRSTTLFCLPSVNTTDKLPHTLGWVLLLDGPAAEMFHTRRERDVTRSPFSPSTPSTNWRTTVSRQENVGDTERTKDAEAKKSKRETKQKQNKKTNTPQNATIKTSLAPEGEKCRLRYFGKSISCRADAFRRANCQKGGTRKVNMLYYTVESLSTTTLPLCSANCSVCVSPNFFAALQISRCSWRWKMPGDFKYMVAK